MRIMFLITNLDTGGAQSALSKLVRCLDKEIYQIKIVALNGVGAIGRELIEEGYDVNDLKITCFSQALLGFKWLQSVISTEKIDILHTWLYHSDFVSLPIKFFFPRLRVIWCVRHTDIWGSHLKKYTLLIVMMCGWFSHIVPNKIVFVSETALNKHTNIGYCSYKSVIIPNGFDLQRYKPDSRTKEKMKLELGIPTHAFCVGFVGRYHKNKNVEAFLRVAKEATSLEDEIYFIGVGTGISADNNYLSNYASEIYGKQLFLLGEREDIDRLMKMFDLLILTSSTEAFPNVIGEAMSTEVVCLATDVGDCSAIVGPFGSTFEVDADQDFVEKIIFYFKHREVLRQTAVGARNRIKENYSLVSMSLAYKSLYADVL